MRLSLALVVLLPSVVLGQPTADQKKATVKWVTDMQDPNGGFYPAPQDPDIDAAPRPTLRATSAAVRTLKYLGAEVPNKDKHAAFVLKCFDAKTGGFAEPGGKPDVLMTSVGVMAAMELGIPKDKFAKAMDYLKENAKTFEDVRIGAAAVEAWGVKECPFKLDDWFKVARAFGEMEAGDPKDGGARDTGSLVAMWLRLGNKLPEGSDVLGILNSGQRADGGWGKRSEKGETASDLETTYRVMRAYVLLKEKPKDVAGVRKFVESHRNPDGGFGAKPKDKSAMGPTYYGTIILKWLDELEGKK